MRVKISERLLVHNRMQTSALVIRDLNLLDLGITRLDSERICKAHSESELLVSLLEHMLGQTTKREQACA